MAPPLMMDISRGDIHLFFHVATNANIPNIASHVMLQGGLKNWSVSKLINFKNIQYFILADMYIVIS